MPAPGVAVKGDVAVEDVEGVHVTIDGAWQGDPGDLPRIVTPVRVSVENHSGRPLRVRYQDLTLAGASGFRYAALPPFSLQGNTRGMARPIARPCFFHRGSI